MVALLNLMTPSQAQVVKADFDLTRKGAEIASLHNGIFFEEINHAGDGGLYAEMIRNRSFEDNATEAEFWHTLGKASMELTSSNPLNANNPHALKLTAAKAGDGIYNDGWWGIKVVKGEKYSISLWVRTEAAASLTASFETSKGKNLGSAVVKAETAKAGQWTKVEATITATATASENVRFVLRASKPGVIHLDMVSVFPPTYRNRPNGLRRDLAEMIASLKPSFLRFPGGCVVEGNKTAEYPETNRFEWKKTLGPIEERPGHYNNNWFYPVTDGLGMMEYLQFCEDLKAEPLFVCNMGMGHGWEDPDVQKYIQEALDAIEFCNGDASTTWGRKRIALGHPAPFNLKMMEIGNENEGFGPYTHRYGLFQKAIHEKYPYMQFVGNGFEWNRPHPVDIIDPHFYMSPSWFITEYHRYDNSWRDGLKYYVGEYAAMSGRLNCLNAALGEAVFMLGMERNADVVVMNSYAPLLVNDNNRQWIPDLIPFNHATAVETPSYYVQKLMSNYHGNVNIVWKETNNREQHPVRVGFSSYATSVAYDNLLVKNIAGDTLYFNDFSKSDLSEWTGEHMENWEIRSGRLIQKNPHALGELIFLNKTFHADYIVECDAEKLYGDEGFILAFNAIDADNYAWWNVGGWSNRQQGVEQCMNGMRQNDGGDIKEMTPLEAGKTYRMKVTVQGNSASCMLDGFAMSSKRINLQDQKLFFGATEDEEHGKLYLRVVNPYRSERQLELGVKSGAITEAPAVHVLRGEDPRDENSIDEPNKVKLATRTMEANQYDEHTIRYTVPPFSFSVFEVKTRK